MDRLHFGFWLVFLAAAATPASAGGEAEISDKMDGEAAGMAIVEAYNSRDFGAPGRRTVTLALENDGRVVRRFRVINLWRAQDGAAHTLFYLEAPEGLRHTSYLLTEDLAAGADMGVHLFLPAGKRRVLAIAPSRFRDGLLGSDFGYADLRMLLPTADWRYRHEGRTKLLGHETLIVEAEPLNEAAAMRAGWRRGKLYLAAEFSFLLGADYFVDGNAPTPFKTMRVETLERIDGVWTATRMTMSGENGRASTLSLIEAAFHLPDLPAAWFEPEALPLLGERLAPKPTQKRPEERP